MLFNFMINLYVLCAPFCWTKTPTTSVPRSAHGDARGAESRAARPRVDPREMYPRVVRRAGACIARTRCGGGDRRRDAHHPWRDLYFSRVVRRRARSAPPRSHRSRITRTCDPCAHSCAA